MPDERILARLTELPVMQISLDVSTAEISRKLPRLIHTLRIMGCLPISAIPTGAAGGAGTRHGPERDTADDRKVGRKVGGP